MRRREFIVLAGSTALAGSLATTGCSGLFGSQENPDLLETLKNPNRDVRPQIRWWWPGGAVDPLEIRKEVGILADAGFGGFEIADVRDSVSEPIDPATLGWASPAWNKAVEAALEEAVDRDLQPSLTLGPHWPTGIPGVRPDDPEASKELVYGMVQLAGGERFAGAVPPPVQSLPSGALPVQNENPPVTPQLLAIQAFRIVGQEGGVTVLDPESRIAIDSMPALDSFEWTAPEAGDWALFSFFMRGTGQIQNMFGMNRTASMLADPTPYVLDIYGPDAVAALTRYWDENLLSPRIRELMRQSGGTFFEDSLELSAAYPWTPSALEEFEKRRGYDLTPYLPLLVSRQPTMEEMILGGGRPALFALDGVDIERVRHDFDSTLSEMYVENRLLRLSDWARGLGMQFRVQAIGSEINSGLAAAYADIPEGDNSNDIHGWRKLAAGRDIGGKTILSDEAATFVRGSAHVADWADALFMLQRDMVGGANQIMLHGFSYADAPGAEWPGFSAFGRSIGNDWGPRDPQWTMAPQITAYLGRMQALLREGRTHADLAVLGKTLKSQSVLHAGYTFQYPAMELFDWPQMAVADGVLMRDGPAYRALVLNELPAIDLSVARRLENFLANGLPIIVVGTLPLHDRGWNAHSEADNEISQIMARLKASELVRQVDRQADVVDALNDLGVDSLIEFSKPHRILALHRRSTERQLFYLLNDSEVPTSQAINLVAEGTVYQIDLWNGTIDALQQQRSGSKVSIQLELAANEPAMILVSAKPIEKAVEPPQPPATDGEIQLGPWQVEFERWLPGEKVDEIRTEIATRQLDQLASWQKVPGFEGMSGIARYSATANVNGSPRLGALLDLGKIEGTATVSVNGSTARAVNPFTTRVVIGDLMRNGVNNIEVTVASSLNNVLVAEGIENKGFKPPINQDEGGPPTAPPSSPSAPQDPDMIDGTPSGSGMQPGAAPPGGNRTYQDYGLIGPVFMYV